MHVCVRAVYCAIVGRAEGALSDEMAAPRESSVVGGAHASSPPLTVQIITAPLELLSSPSLSPCCAVPCCALLWPTPAPPAAGGEWAAGLELCAIRAPQAAAPTALKELMIAFHMRETTLTHATRHWIGHTP